MSSTCLLYVNLGKTDLCPLDARILLGKNKIIGGTANTLDDCINLVQKKVNYIGLGPYQDTNTKKNLSPILELKGYQNIIRNLRNMNINIPIYAIGGIVVKDFDLLKNVGVSGLAVSSLLTGNFNDKILEEYDKSFNS